MSTASHAQVPNDSCFSSQVVREHHVVYVSIKVVRRVYSARTNPPERAVTVIWPLTARFMTRLGVVGLH